MNANHVKCPLDVCRTVRRAVSRKRNENGIARNGGSIGTTAGDRRASTIGIDLPKTRGVPSTSVDLKEALCEKIPIHHDLLRNFRRQHGPSVISHVTVDSLYRGLRGVDALVKETAEIDPRSGIRYRGLTIPEVITLLPREGSSPSAEAIFWLLLTGDVPSREQISWLVADWSKRREKRKDWWLGPNGGLVGSVLRGLPRTVDPLARLAVALAILDADRSVNEAAKNGVPSHARWEYAYEDCMELLATLPAIVALVATNERLENVNCNGDWANFLTECLRNASKGSEGARKSMCEFLRLYIALNADEDGGLPGAHVTQILADSRSTPSQALAAGVLAYIDEPRTGTLHQCMDFQKRIRNVLGGEPKENALESVLASIVENGRPIGHREAKFADSRYNALLDYVKQNLSEDSDVKLSRDVTRVLTKMTKSAKGKHIFPEQNAIAAPIMQFYGLKDMRFNQALLCTSRALGAIASIIWSRAIEAPVEQPKSKCTYTYLSSLQNARKRTKKGKRANRYLV